MKLEALYNAVIVKPVEAEETSYGGIIVPDLGNEKNKLAEVVAVGDGSYRDWETDRKSTRLNSSHITRSRMPSSA